MKYPVAILHHPNDACLFPASGKIVHADLDYNYRLTVWVLVKESEIDLKENYVYALTTCENSGNLRSEDYIETVVVNKHFWHLFLAHK